MDSEHSAAQVTILTMLRGKSDKPCSCRIDGAHRAKRAAAAKPWPKTGTFNSWATRQPRVQSKAPERIRPRNETGIIFACS